MPSLFLLARVTMTAAFHRTMRRMRRSISSSPGNHGSWSGGIVLMYGVDTNDGTGTCSRRARSSSLPITKRARTLPSLATSASSDSSHSDVSSGSVSGSWWRKASNVIACFPEYRGSIRERLVQVGDEVVDVFHADGQADERIADSDAGPFGVRDRRVRHQRRKLGKRLDGAERLGQREHVHPRQRAQR